MWKFCPECGHKLDATWKFCADCGKQANAPSAFIWPTYPIYPSPQVYPNPYITWTIPGTYTDGLVTVETNSSFTVTQ